MVGDGVPASHLIPLAEHFHRKYHIIRKENYNTENQETKKEIQKSKSAKIQLMQKW